MAAPCVPAGDPPGGGGVQTQVSAAAHIGNTNGHGDGGGEPNNFHRTVYPLSSATPSENLTHGTSHDYQAIRDDMYIHLVKLTCGGFLPSKA